MFSRALLKEKMNTCSAGTVKVFWHLTAAPELHTVEKPWQHLD